MKKIVSLLMVLAMLVLVGCGSEKESSSEPTFTGPYNPSIHSPYKIDDVVKEDLMWNTEELFALDPEIKDEGAINLGDRITSFKFASAPYTKKEHTSDKTWVFAAIGLPNERQFPMPEGGYPAVLLIHGGAGQVYPEWIKYWTNKGYVAIAYDVFGNELDYNGQKAVNYYGGPDEGKAGSLYDDPDDPYNSWVYHSVYNAIMCNNILRTHEKVNANQIGVTGISWGGIVTNLLSGVDKRFEAFAPVYGAAYLHEDSFWADKGSFGGIGKKEKWIETYDPSSYMPYNTKPTLFVSGIDDNCFSLLNRVRAAELVKGKTFFSQRSDMSHGYYYYITYEIYAFFEHVLLGKDTMSLIELNEADGNKVSFTAEVALYDNVQLVYTTCEQEDTHEWWFARETLTKGATKWTLPKGTTAYCFEFIHEGIDADYRLTTPVVILNR